VLILSWTLLVSRSLSAEYFSDAPGPHLTQLATEVSVIEITSIERLSGANSVTWAYGTNTPLIFAVRRTDNLLTNMNVIATGIVSHPSGQSTFYDTNQVIRSPFYEIAVNPRGVAAAAEIRAVNTVGYHAHTADPGDLLLVSPTVDNFNGNTLEDILGSQLPVNSLVFIWNGFGFDPPAHRSVFFGWSPNYTVMRGQAIFVQISGTAPGAVTFAFTGEVPEARNGGGTSSVTVAGLDATAYPYPVDIQFGETQAAIAAPVGSSVFFWNPVTQRYDLPETKTTFLGWPMLG